MKVSSVLSLCLLGAVRVCNGIEDLTLSHLGLIRRQIFGFCLRDCGITLLNFFHRLCLYLPLAFGRLLSLFLHDKNLHHIFALVIVHPQVALAALLRVKEDFVALPAAPLEGGITRRDGLISNLCSC